MPDHTASAENLGIGIRQQERHDSYLLTLTFTLLGLAVQSASFDGPPAQRMFELLGWGILFASGLSGLRRSRKLPEHYRLVSAAVHNRELEADARLAELRGHRTVTIPGKGDLPLTAYLTDAVTAAEGIEATIAKREDAMVWWARVQRWTFVGGLAALLVSRAYGAF